VRNKIILAPLGEIEFALVNRLASSLASVWGLAVEILHPMEIPQEAHNPQRGQYYSTVALNKLQLLKADDKERILGLIDEDLYMPAISYLFGDADPLSNVAILSISRLKNEFSGIPENEGLLFDRILKESVYQLGRTLNLENCPNPKCVMYASQKVLDIDIKLPKFCDNCQRRVS
jgi:archaemetzincin